jgi:predicted O-methyltransferase YrrM
MKALNVARTFKRKLLARLKGHSSSLLTGQLNNHDFDQLLLEILTPMCAPGELKRTINILEVGAGSGKGSTVSLFRAAQRAGLPFTITSYECDRSLFEMAVQHWQGTKEVRLINEFFMQRSDLQDKVLCHILPEDAESYRATFQRYEQSSTNYFHTKPPVPIDLMFIDSVRYTHLPAVVLGRRFLRQNGVVLMEDDIPDFGETRILEKHLALKDAKRCRLSSHHWPFVSFRLYP